MSDYDRILSILSRYDSLSMQSIYKLLELIERRNSVPYQIDSITAFASGYLKTR